MIYYLLLSITYGISLLPFRILYILSDGLYVLLYHVIGYRKAVVMQNLTLSFPEKTPEERQRIMRAFYRHMTDLMVEIIKSLSISAEEIRKRFVCDFSLLDELYREDKPCEVLLGHQFNWEWANLGLALEARQPVLITYMPLRNRAAERLMMRIRSRFGSVMIPANDVLGAMKPWHDKPHVSILVADQNPGKRRRADWFYFLNRMTAFYKGPELNARRKDVPVLFGDIQKIKRGYYKASLYMAYEHPRQEPEGDITRSFVEFLEKNIRVQPENWLWSHRRWKHAWHGPGVQTRDTGKIPGSPEP